MTATPTVRRRAGAPELEPGITLLREPRGTTGIHRLVARALATATGPAYWVDAGNEAAPRALFRAATDRLALERLRIARAFTAYQHHALVERLVERAGDGTSLVVASSLPALYADDDLLAGEGTALLREGVKRLLRLRRRHDVAVLVGHAPGTDDGVADLLAACADRELAAVETDQGVRFEGDGTATTAYDAGLLDQATLAAFADAATAEDDRVLDSRAADPELDPPTDAGRARSATDAGRVRSTTDVDRSRPAADADRSRRVERRVEA